MLKRSDGGGLALSNFAKKQPVVLFFYPRECNQERMMWQHGRQLPQQLARAQCDQHNWLLAVLSEKFADGRLQTRPSADK